MDNADVTSPDPRAIKTPLNTLVIGLAICLFFPLGLYLLWRHPVLGRNKAWWWAGGIWSFFVLVSAMSGDRDKKPAVAEVARSSASEALKQPSGEKSKAVERPEPSRSAGVEEEAQSEEDKPGRSKSPKPRKVKKGINLENYERITDGMTRGEVEAMLGKGTEASSAGEFLNIIYSTTNIVTGSRKVVSIGYEDGRVVARSKVGF